MTGLWVCLDDPACHGPVIHVISLEDSDWWSVKWEDLPSILHCGVDLSVHGRDAGCLLLVVCCWLSVAGAWPLLLGKVRLLVPNQIARTPGVCHPMSRLVSDMPRKRHVRVL